MHYHCEIVIPPTSDVDAAVAAVLKPYCENDHGLDEDDASTSRAHGFWDFYVIGGRVAGRKLLAGYDKALIDQFYEWCTAEKITVSSFQCGKQELQPASQIPKVDAKWNEMFPSDPPIPCPLFNHSNDQYGRGGKGAIRGDICALKDIPADLSCERVIFAAPNHGGDALEAKFMLCESQWNGCNHMPINWDGKVSSALEQFRAKLENYKKEYRDKVLPQPDWLVVTVDYHS